MATFAVGDIQGCLHSLLDLLDEAGFSPARDRLWVVGDLVNRGPRSLETLRYLKQLGSGATVVQGNHDLHLAMVAAGYGRQHREDTLQGILEAPDRADLLAWLRAQPLFHVEADYAMVHAGLLPQWSVARASELSAEVHATLAGELCDTFLAHMYGSLPATWADSLVGWDRLRVIVNAMTRMRFCSPSGEMDLRTKGPVSAAPPGFMPWFDVPERASLSHTIVCGHWSALGFHQARGVLALDSGCLWGGSMTAVRLEDQKVFQVPCPRSVEPSGWD